MEYKIWGSPCKKHKISTGNDSAKQGNPEGLLFEKCGSHHFHTVRRQHSQREAHEEKLPKDALLVQLDFMENMSWPLGPEEAQDWFWATSREAMTTLGFYVCVWRGNVLCKENYHYISQILNHDSAYACQCLCLG